MFNLWFEIVLTYTNLHDIFVFSYHISFFSVREKYILLWQIKVQPFVDIVKEIKIIFSFKESLSIPGLGTFSFESDKVQSSHESFLYPPTKQLRFNCDLKIVDDFLVNYLSQKYNVEKPIAVLAINDFVSTIHEKTAQGRYEIENFGVFQLVDNNIAFTMSLDWNANPSCYGLKSIKLPIARPKPTTTSNLNKIERADIIIAVLCGILTLIIGVFLVNMFTNGGVVTLIQNATTL